MNDDMVGLELVVVVDKVKVRIIGRGSSVLCEDGHIHGASHVPCPTGEALDATIITIVWISNRCRVTGEKEIT